MRLRALSGAVFAGFLLVFACAPSSPSALAQDAGAGLPVIRVDNGTNTEAAQKAHYVVLVSLDGFRWDYARRDGATHLLALGKKGVWAPEGMMPTFPSLTFPNHFAIVTGLYPEHHGLVANSFYDPAKNALYAINDPAAVTDGSWYNGTPLWSLAESQGMRTACMFWPGSEAKIAGYRPTYYLHFDNKIDDYARIGQVLAWLHLPSEERPHLITLYYDEPDHEGHQYGPDAPETKAAVVKVDKLVGKLKEGLDATGLPIDLVVVSDHGMAKVEGDWITLDTLADLTGFEAVGPLLYAKSDADAARLYNQLKKASSQFVVYRRRDFPAELNYRDNPRIGDPVLLPTGPFVFRAHAPSAGKTDNRPPAGMHGYDPHKMPEMKASFFAAGPDIVSGRTVRPFENVNLYPWLAHILELNPPKSDGSLNVLAGTLRDNGGEASQQESGRQ